ncbi:16S rRNA (guanine(527)-N(7))-methyltransferase RsmG [Argonema antarcticum]|uniref:16S rRNA (guanine(527)-N(7))-methyltransferase RsmG n=1 Tax=Argonema antarcticum TaxID=2942763 RepID=UPI0020112154|nr:16S rRNA (guanine(527)-N(7))-methyltransferase RsmG [Argonema antarcticum]MCL1474665.1 16S rRNA (guanine(527)-N(7))-methyltransferase RsmG [Argonema antarcticum A004/B2]
MNSDLTENSTLNTQNDSLLPEMVSVWQETLSWQPNVEQQQLFQRLHELILLGNQQLNLTRITGPIEFWEKHLWDSLRGIAPFLGNSALTTQHSALSTDSALTQHSALSTQHSALNCIDIGTGAGFPGLPVAIAQPNWHITLLDSTRKKIAFLETLLIELGIKNTTTLTGRSEEVGKQRQHREYYDIALIRAVGSASICAEYALPLLKVGGLAILYRGNWTAEENSSLQPTLEWLGGTIESTEQFTTPLSKSVRHCLYLRKIESSNKIKNVKLKIK